MFKLRKLKFTTLLILLSNIFTIFSALDISSKHLTDKLPAVLNNIIMNYLNKFEKRKPVDIFKRFKAVPLKVGPCKQISNNLIVVGAVWTEYDNKRIDQYTLKIFDIDKNICIKTFDKYHSSPITKIEVLPKSKFGQQLIASGSYDTTIKIWNTETGKYLKTLTEHTSPVIKLKAVSENILVSSAYWGTIKIWDIQTGNCINTITKTVPGGFPDALTNISIMTDNKIMAGYATGDICIWDMLTGKLIEQVAHEASYNKFLLINDKQLAYINSHGVKNINFLDLKTKLCTKKLKHEYFPSDFILIPNNRIASIDGQTINIWDIATGAKLQTLTGHEENIKNIICCTDNFLVSSDSTSVKIWDLKNYKLVESFDFDSEISSLSIASNKIIVGYNEGTLTVIENQILELRGQIEKQL